MQTIQKTLSVFLLLVLGLLVCATSANALEFTKITVNGVEYDTSVYDYNTIQIDRGEDLDIRVELVGDQASDEDHVRVRVWIGGYKYDEVEDTTGRFDVSSGTKYVKNLNLKVPEDIDPTGDYRLHVEAYGQNDYLETNEANFDFVLEITPVEDLVKIQDVIINPGLTVEAGKPIYVTVRAENLGANKQEDVRVVVSIPELGISARTYINELCATECCDNSDSCCNEDDETSQSSDELMLKIPENTKKGTYEMVVELEYDRFHKTTKQTYLIYVDGKSSGTGTTENGQVNRIINVDTSVQEVAQGKGVIYRITLANLGNNAEIYNFEVGDVESWGTVRVDPVYVNVDKDSIKEVYVYVAANENAAEGLHMFTVKVKSNDNVIKDISLGANVKENQSTLGLTQMLWIVFGVLVLVVLILGIVLLIKRAGDDSDAEEPSMTEGQTYY